MFGLSIPIKIFQKSSKAKKQIEALDKAIAEAEREYSEPFINTLSGVERFESTVVLIDSTFLKRIQSISDQNGKGELIQAYLNKLSEEYQMAKEDLQRTTASRAEVVALGLAVKEIALCLDREIAAFRQQSGKAIGQFKGVTDKHQLEAQQLTANFKQQQSRIRDENEKYRTRVQADLESLKAEQATRFKNLTASVTEEIHRLSTGIEQQMTEAGEKHQQLLRELSSRHEEAVSRFENVATKHQLEMQRRASELKQQVTQIREENENHRGHIQAELESAKAEQATRFTNLAASVNEELHRLSAGIQQQIVEAGEKQKLLLSELSTKHERDTEHLTKTLNTMRQWTAIGFVLLSLVCLFMVLN